jgi:hypothetical protein
LRSGGCSDTSRRRSLPRGAVSDAGESILRLVEPFGSATLPHPASLRTASTSLYWRSSHATHPALARHRRPRGALRRSGSCLAAVQPAPFRYASCSAHGPARTSLFGRSPPCCSPLCGRSSESLSPGPPSGLSGDALDSAATVALRSPAPLTGQPILPYIGVRHCVAHPCRSRKRDFDSPPPARETRMSAMCPLGPVTNGSYRKLRLSKWLIKVSYLSFVCVVLGPVDYISIVLSRDAYIVGGPLCVTCH